ncbi:hypothetical protein AMST5_01944 [freshwater sediment metagenome]|uniref:Uncharacterized protein n=1 Tax=freshwater sediment metagenome TaxID=556182 RepID=A0AA48RD77_9ZZZZ
MPGWFARTSHALTPTPPMATHGEELAAAFAENGSGVEAAIGG